MRPAPGLIWCKDGHGSSKCFRSDRGSALAVKTAVEILSEFFQGEWAKLGQQEQQEQLHVRLPKRIQFEWRQKVNQHLHQNQLNRSEIDKLENTHSRNWRKHWRKLKWSIYGATLLAVVIVDSFVAYVQLGDGDIVAVLDSGDVIRPLPDDERLIANETTSLSSENAAADFRVHIQSVDEQLPDLILLATDGYSNSFRDDASFIKAANDFHQLLKSPGGAAEITQHLDEWLHDSAEMSGDDVTICLLRRVNAGSTEHKNIESLNQKPQQTIDTLKATPTYAPSPDSSESLET